MSFLQWIGIGIAAVEASVVAYVLARGIIASTFLDM